MGKKYPLSAIDHVFTGVGSYPVEFIFRYNKRIDEKRLRDSLLKTVEFFPMISSLLVSQNDDSYGFELSPDGLLFSVADSPLNFEENENKYDYIDPVETLEGSPLSRIRLTHMPEGSVLGVSISHSLADGFSYFHFLSSWARIFHGKQIFPPVHQRELLNTPEVIENDILGNSFRERTGLFLEDKRIPIPKNKLMWETRNYKQDQIKELLSETQQEADLRLSHNDLVTSLLAQEYLVKWSRENGAERCYISCPVDFRRLLEGFPVTYFGNAVAMASFELPLKTLKEIGLADLAGKIRKNTGKVNGSFIRQSISTLISLRKQLGRKIFERVHVMHPQGGLLVTNLSRLPIQDIEFDAGPPVQYDILTQTVRGAVVLPAQDGYEARICCPIDN